MNLHSNFLDINKLCNEEHTNVFQHKNKQRFKDTAA